MSLALAEFIDNHMFAANGIAVPFSQFYERFIAHVADRHKWTKQRVSRALKTLGIESGSRTGNQTYIGNLSFESIGDQPFRYIAVERKGQRPYLARETQ